MNFEEFKKGLKDYGLDLSDEVWTAISYYTFIAFWCKNNSQIQLKNRLKNVLSQMIKTESIRKLNNFNFQWTKTFHQNILSHITFLFTLSKGYRCNSLSVSNNTKEYFFILKPEKINLKFHRNWENTGKIDNYKISFCGIWIKEGDIGKKHKTKKLMKNNANRPLVNLLVLFFQAWILC